MAKQCNHFWRAVTGRDSQCSKCGECRRDPCNEPDCIALRARAEKAEAGRDAWWRVTERVTQERDRFKELAQCEICDALPEGFTVCPTCYDKVAKKAMERDAALEKVAQWAIEHSFATGHADDLGDLLAELGHQVNAIRDKRDAAVRELEEAENERREALQKVGVDPDHYLGTASDYQLTRLRRILNGGEENG